MDFFQENSDDDDTPWWMSDDEEDGVTHIVTLEEMLDKGLEVVRYKKDMIARCHQK